MKTRLLPIVAVLCSGQICVAQTPPSLFLHQDTEKVEAGLPAATLLQETDVWSEGMIQRAYAVVDSDVLTSLEKAGGGVTFNLFEDAEFVSDLAYSENALLGLALWRGEIEGEVPGHVVLSRVLRPPRSPGATLSSGIGVIQGGLRVGARAFRIRPVRGVPGIVAVEEVDPTAPSGPDDPGNDSWPIDPETIPDPANAGEGSGSDISMLVLYTNSALNTYGGAMASVAQTLQDSINIAFDLTSVDAEVYVVGVEPLDLEFGTSGLDSLEDLGTHPDAVLMRQGHGADVVMLLYGASDPFWHLFPEIAGIGMQMNANENNHGFYPFAYSAVRVTVAATFGHGGPAHELGHNMGACHDQFHYERCVPTHQGGAVRSDAVAFKAQHPGGHTESLMWVGATNPAWMFSSRSVVTQGAVLGDDAHENDLTLEVTKGTVANFEGGFELGTVDVNLWGSGSGRVTSDDYLLDCAPFCHAQWPLGVRRLLVAAPNVGSYFVGWDGLFCNSSSSSLNIQIFGNYQCDAYFEAVDGELLTAQKVGLGLGSLESDPPGIECPAGCSEQSAEFEEGVQVVLEAEASGSSQFNGWAGDCTEVPGEPGQGSVVMSADRLCQASFDQVGSNERLLVVNKNGNGSGTVIGPGIDCGADCTETYALGSTVEIVAVAGADSQFGGWSGNGCNPSGSTAQVDMSANRTCVATLNRQSRMLHVGKRGNGRGTVTSSPSGISCGPSCENESAEFFLLEEVVLTAIPESGTSQFSRWFGDCSGTSPQTAPIVIDGEKTCEAEFVPEDPVTLQLIVMAIGEGDPSLEANPGGFVCQGSCNDAAFIPGTWVTVTPDDDGMEFQSWGGVCAGEPAEAAVIQLNQSGTCSATFRCPEPPCWQE